ncbi:MAG: hypothetical protein WBO23_14365 [Burkholderiales bacterium]
MFLRKHYPAAAINVVLAICAGSTSSSKVIVHRVPAEDFQFSAFFVTQLMKTQRAAKHTVVAQDACLSIELLGVIEYQLASTREFSEESFIFFVHSSWLRVQMTIRTLPHCCCRLRLVRWRLSDSLSFDWPQANCGLPDRQAMDRT